jgi:hypothetical protein
MRIMFNYFVLANVIFASLAHAASSDITDLEKQLQQKDDRIQRLEEEVDALRQQLMDLQYGVQDDIGRSLSVDRNTIDPLIGTWECTNRVYNYEISFFDDGHLVQEEPFFSKVRETNWLRLDENRLFIGEGGVAYNTEFRSHDELTVTNPGNRVVWECSRKQ